MNRYIDADKLIAEIGKILAKAEKDEKKSFYKIDANGHLIAVTKTAMCARVKKIITSLQQEQPECSVDTSKTNAFPTHIDWNGSPINTKRIESGDTEYIRKDALLEWAKEKQRQMKVEAGTCHIISAAGKFLAYKEIIEKIESL